MLKYEFKKLFQSKLFVILFALLLLLNIGLCYRSAKEVAGSVTIEPEILEQMAQEAPIGRNGTPEDIAQAFLYLADADFVTGQVLPVNGGYVI